MKGQPQQRVQVHVQTPRVPDGTGDIGLLIDLLMKKWRPAQAWQVEIILVDDRRIIALNKQFFFRTVPTDVIAFNWTSPRDPLLHGEIYIDTDQAKRQAPEFGATWVGEILRLAAHGTLHLLGLEDDTAQRKRRMSKAEDDVLKRLKLYGIE
jgi:probable rRNA maturation factor